MADIDVVQKKHGSGWLMWLILAVVAIAVVWMLVGRDRGENEPVGTSRGPVPIHVVVAATTA